MSGPSPVKLMSASGQLGYGVLKPAFERGLRHEPHMIGADMGSVDPGPAYLGMGKMATDPGMTRRDLTMLLEGARSLGVPLIIGTAGTAGAAPHLDAVLAIVRDIAAERGLSFKLASIRADIPKDRVLRAQRAGELSPLGAFPAASEADIQESPYIVAQMDEAPMVAALEAGADVVIAGRACDTAIYTTVAMMRGHGRGLATHMAKIIECASLCCDPGGRDSMLATLDAEGFTLDCMNPDRHATPTSVAAHALYEQGDPFTVREPSGELDLSKAVYTALDEHRVRVSGASWRDTTPSLKLEAAAPAGFRSVFFAGTSDPRVIARIDQIWTEVRAVVADLTGEDANAFLRARFYGLNGVVNWPAPPDPLPREIGILVECIAPTREQAKSVITVTKQYFLHHGFPGRLSTAGNLAFPFTPPEVEVGPAWRFSLHHVMQVADAAELQALFPITYEDL
ncbi:MAG: acyclic terpene utilization AtuA family protein [Proteobacteria bacterium]|nr:acyclic terpene utilization AtuA family protein [Pseudomonadota bacterium]